jgi:hypothetical protein
VNPGALTNSLEQSTKFVTNEWGAGHEHIWADSEGHPPSHRPGATAKYKAAAEGDRALAFELYRWNVQISAALFESMHYFEIGFRNTAHEALQSKKELLDPGGPPWFDNPHFPLQGQGPRIVNLARRRASTVTDLRR